MRNHINLKQIELGKAYIRGNEFRLAETRPTMAELAAELTRETNTPYTVANVQRLVTEIAKDDPAFRYTGAFLSRYWAAKLDECMASFDLTAPLRTESIVAKFKEQHGFSVSEDSAHSALQRLRRRLGIFVVSRATTSHKGAAPAPSEDPAVLARLAAQDERIEEQGKEIAQLRAALRSLYDAFMGREPKPAEGGDGVTLDEVRETLVALPHKVAREIVSKHGEKLSQIPPSQYPAILADAKAAQGEPTH